MVLIIFLQKTSLSKATFMVLKHKPENNSPSPTKPKTKMEKSADFSVRFNTLTFTDDPVSNPPRPSLLSHTGAALLSSHPLLHEDSPSSNRVERPPVLPDPHFRCSQRSSLRPGWSTALGSLFPPERTMCSLLLWQNQTCHRPVTHWGREPGDPGWLPEERATASSSWAVRGPGLESGVTSTVGRDPPQSPPTSHAP